MSDRAYIIIRTLETKIAMAEHNGNNALIVTLDVLKEILATLKEQGAVVRCKGCKKHDTYDCNITYLTTQKTPDDWFCADGKRKD